MEDCLTDTKMYIMDSNHTNWEQLQIENNRSTGFKSLSQKSENMPPENTP